jgi:pilus assembly protein CpaD
MMSNKQPAGFVRKACIALALTGVSMAMGACTHTSQDVTSSIPDDYRLRHPMVIQESSKSTEIFVGAGRGGLTAAQRADVVGLGQTWLREGTGSIIAEVPVGTPNARSAAETYREVQSLLTAMGVPARGLTLRQYHPENPEQFATLRLKYPRITAEVGPCGTWPDDIGPSIKNKGYLDNKPYWNFGCSYQHNMAVMADNPADLVQPRAETPAYTARRTASFEKYRKGTTTGTTYPETEKAKLSDLGK